jgi:2-haloacid dehalogenase
MKYKTVLFDLDDTIFDYQYARRSALRKLNDHYHLTTIPIEVFEKIHQHYLDRTFNRVLAKTITSAESRKERMLLLFRHFGHSITERETDEADAVYRDAYNKNRRCIPGVYELIQALKKHGKIGIITNGLKADQHEKIKICQLDNEIDYIIISEEIGSKKPEKEFFLKTLKIINNARNECIVVGDSWEADISGAYQCGIKSIWLNRYAEPCPDPRITTEITSYINIKKILPLFL